MGWLDRWFGKKTAPSPSVESADEPAPAAAVLPDAVVVVRQGMNVPDEAYVGVVVQLMLGQAPPPELQRAGVAQPRWFKAGEFTKAGVADIAEAYGLKFGLGRCRHRHTESAGPDGARVMLVELWREG